MDASVLLTPSQIRAGRALLDWSQERLAQAAGVGLSTVRDYEKERRGGVAGGLKALRQALENEGIVFIPSEGDHGPGVRLIARVPNVLRRPRELGECQALLVLVEWRGHEIELVVTQEVLEDLGRCELHSGAEYVTLFDQHRATILKAAARVIDAGRVMPDRRVHLIHTDFSELV